MGPIALYLVTTVVLAYAVFGLVLFFLQPKLLYQPGREVASTPADLDLDFEEITFRSSDGIMLTGWYVPIEKSHFTVLFCHGNGGNIMHRLDSLGLFHSLGLSCLVFDYRGYGNSQGRPTEAGTFLDARAAYDWLVRERHVPTEQIILFGRSLGGSVAAHLAARVLARALVVESAFTSYPDIGTRFYPYMPVRLFARFQYNTRAYVREVSCPVLIVHSRDDELVPFEFGSRLFEAAHEPKRFVEIFGNHADGFLLSGDVYRNAWVGWLDFLKDREAQGATPKAS